jgi:hypothetical protein
LPQQLWYSPRINMSAPGYYPPAENYPPPPNPWGPFTAGDLLRRTIEIYRERPALFLSISFLSAALNFVVQAPNQILNYFLQSHPPLGLGAIFSRGLLQMTFGILVMLAAAFVFAITHGVIYTMVASLRRGIVPTLSSSLDAVAPRLARIAGGYILGMLRVFGWCLLVVAPIMIVAVLAIALFSGIAASASGSHAASAASIGFTIIILVLVLVLILPFIIWLWLRYAVFVPVVLEENLGANASLRRSIELTRHGKGRLLAVYATVVLITLPFIVLGGLAGFASAKSHRVIADLDPRSHAGRLHLRRLPGHAHPRHRILALLLRPPRPQGCRARRPAVRD